jgi:hypothetical protein
MDFPIQVLTGLMSGPGSVDGPPMKVARQQSVAPKPALTAGADTARVLSALHIIKGV